MTRRLLACVCLFVVSPAAGGQAPPFQVFLDPPPGWTDATEGRRSPEVLAALKGPETSSFVLTRIASMPLDNRGVVRALLVDILAALNQKTGLRFTLASNLTTASYANGLTVQYIRADHKGKPRLILALIEYGGATMLATLISAVPDTLLPSILGSLKVGSSPAGLSSRETTSLDGQLSFRLPEGVQGRLLSERERRMGFVLAVSGLGSELMVMKLVGEGTSVKDQPRIVKDTVLTVAGVVPDSLAPLNLYETPAGPELISAWAKVQDASGGGQFLAGYMPWAYWGYSVLAKGPAAAELAEKAFAGLSLGPAALPKLVEKTPRVPLSPELRLKRLKGRLSREAAWGLGAGMALLLLGLFRRWRTPRAG